MPLSLVASWRKFVRGS